MGSGSSGSQGSSSIPGTVSPITAAVTELFGGGVGVHNGQFVPTALFGGLPGNRPFGGVFNAGSFAPIGDLLNNQPLTSSESSILGAGAGPDGTPAFGVNPGFQDLAAQGLFGDTQTQRDIFSQAVSTLPALLDTEPDAAIAAARREFSQDTVPAILERAPGFSSSDLQRELVRGGVDLDTNVAALREANLGRVAQTVAGIPDFANAVGGQSSSLIDRAGDILGFGQLGREFLRETSPAGDAFRVLAALQSLTGPAITTESEGSGKQKSVGVLG